MLLSGAAVAGLGVSVVNAGLLIDVRAVSINGQALNGTTNTSKNITVVNVGDTIAFRVFADVTGSDASKFQTLQSLRARS